MSEDRVGMVVVAAGGGTRMGGGEPKQFRDLLGTPLYIWSIEPFQDSESVHEIVVVVPANREATVLEECARFHCGKVSAVVAGGAQRQDSVAAGIAALSPECSIIGIHDAARPFPPDDISRIIAAAEETGAAIFATPIVDTIKRGNEYGVVEGTIPREHLWAAQTPQFFRRETLANGYYHVQTQQLPITDEAAAVEAAGGKVQLVPGSHYNLKLTTFEDWKLAELFARHLARDEWQK